MTAQNGCSTIVVWFEYGLHTYELKCEAVKRKGKVVEEKPYSLKEKK